jgi:radical SAM protein with 4Fe4S-binding SPASM domain
MSCLQEHWGLEFSRQQIEESQARNGLLSLELELSRACNLRCIYCYASSGAPKENELLLPEILRVIDEAVEMGAKKIIVLGGGEPLMYPELFTVIDYILNKNIEVDLFTNGLLMDNEKAQKLYERNVGVVMKMNSRDKDTQDILAGVKGTFSSIEKGIAALKEVGYPDKNHTLGVETIICRHNYDELPDLWRWARNQDVIPYVEMMTFQGRAKENPELEVSMKEIQTLFENLAKIDANEFDKVWTPLPPLAASHCARHEYSCTVTADGDVHPCPGVSKSVGNIRENTLAEIIKQSKVIQDLRSIRSSIKGKCGDCEFGSLCYGCRGHAYQVTGDYLAEDPMCWIQPIQKLQQKLEKE